MSDSDRHSPHPALHPNLHKEYSPCSRCPSRESHDEESALTGRPKGLSPSNSQQLELDDALASTADLDGPCDVPDKHAGCLKRLCLPGLRCCGDSPSPPCLHEPSSLHEKWCHCTKGTVVPLW